MEPLTDKDGNTIKGPLLWPTIEMWLIRVAVIALAVCFAVLAVLT